jgi:hypothetical protein
MLDPNKMPTQRLCREGIGSRQVILSQHKHKEVREGTEEPWSAPV